MSSSGKRTLFFSESLGAVASAFEALSFAVERAVRSKTVFSLFALVFLFGAASAAQAAEKFCSTFPQEGDYHVIDGDVVGTSPNQITIDTHCMFRDWPASNPLTATINYQTNDPSVYLIVFDNVWYEGNLACSNIPHKLWAVNSGGFSAKCQEILIPAETIDKQSPEPTARVGEPFTYTLIMPSMNYPAGDPSPNTVGNVRLHDDLTTTGADLTFVSLNAYYLGSNTPVNFVKEDDPAAPGGVWTPKNLSYKPLPVINAGEQIAVEITVVLDDTANNTAGTQFVNTAKWWFSRSIDLNEDGVIDPATEFFDPLPGESGVAAPMTVVEPNLQVNKSSDSTALNIGVIATFTIDVQNVGGGQAWNTTLVDRLPDFATAGMCSHDPRTELTAEIFAADGVTSVSGALTQGVDFTADYSACELTLTFTSPNAVIGPSERLIVTYESQLDGASDPDGGTTADGFDLTNVAGVTQWFSADPSGANPYRSYSRSVTDGTPAVLDHQDSYTITTALHGYYFEKTVANLNTGLYPAQAAAPGDRLRYTLRLFNVDQTIDNITIEDVLDPNVFDLNSYQLVSMPADATDGGGPDGTGLLTITGAPGTPLNVAPANSGVLEELVVEFEITLSGDINSFPLVGGVPVADNQANLSADQNTADPGDDFAAASDDPYDADGVASPDVDGDEGPTRVVIQTPGPLLKESSQASATIGEQFTYLVTVPAVPLDSPLYDVQILDDLTASAADLHFVSAAVVSGGSWSLTNSGTLTNPLIEDTATGIDIPAGGQAVIAITVELQNTSTNQDGLLFSNTASYSYRRMNSGSSPRSAGGADTSDNMVVVEPALTAGKEVNYVSPAGKVATDPATVGDVLEYTLTIPNDSDATAFNVSVVDLLPAELALVSDSATAAIYDPGSSSSTPVANFEAEPTVLPDGALAWGDQNGDSSLDLPSGRWLVLSYQATVEAVSGNTISNTAYVDWASLDVGGGAERTGAGCPATVAPDSYCTGPATASIGTQDNTAIAKLVIADSYAEDPASAAEPVLRVGDTVTFELPLSIQEYTTRNVVVEDVLPEGMAFESYSIDAGSSAFSYTLSAEPQAGDTGSLIWNFGDIDNPPDGSPLDTLLIRYVARVVTDAPPTGVSITNSQLLSNNASLSYEGGDPATYPDRLTATAAIEVRQPQMSAITKVDQGTGRVGTGSSGDPYQVDIASDLMSFQLATCNNGDAPAYGVVITDQLSMPLDEGDLASAPAVSLGGNPLTAGTDFLYTAPARGGEMRVELQDSAPVNPGQCITVDYGIGFHTDVANQSTWSNEASLAEYRSLPLAQSGRIYAPVESASVWMTNVVEVAGLSKTLSVPVSGEATVGQTVVYEIVVPAEPVNAALDNVQVSDALHGALEYVGATAVDSGGAAVTLTDTSSAGQVDLGIGQIAAGEQVTITLTTRVGNNAQAVAGASFVNTASYTYDGIPADAITADSSEPLMIVEPDLAISKSVVNQSNPGAPPKAGDLLGYTLSFVAGGGAAEDNFSDAFDLLIEDSLSLGLAYQNGSATVGAGNSISDPTANGDGVATAQTLVWSLADATADIDVTEGGTVTVSYEVLVLNNVVAGQTLSNSATVQWTGLDGDSPNERNGSQSPAENDYIAGPVTTSLNTVDNTGLSKIRLTDTWGGSDGNVRIGDLIDYELRLHLDEGSHDDLVLTDVLPAGLQFEQVVSVNGQTSAPYDPVSPFDHAPIAAPAQSGDAAVGSTTITWTLGDLINAADGNDGNDEFVIIYRTRVLNEVFAQTNTTTLTNTASLSYVTADGSATQQAGESVSLLQPNIVVSKTAAPAGGDIAISAGESITYTVDVTNNGSAPAYDVVVRDTLPVGLRQGGVTTTSMSLEPAGSSLPLLQPNYDAATGVAEWDLDTGVANAYTIPANQSLRIIYTVTADANIGPGLTLTNSVQVTDYYSFDNDAVPSQSTVTGVAEHYGPSESAEFTLTTPLPGAPLKQNPASPTLHIGETFTYTVTVPAEPLPTALHDVRIIDELGAIAADLTLISVDKIAGSGSWTPAYTMSGGNLIVEDATTGIDIPANEQITVGITLRLDNTADNQEGNTFTNTASYTYNQTDNDSATQLEGGSSTTSELEVVEGALTVTKTANPLSDPITGGSIVEYVVTINNSGKGTAYDINVVDTLPPELALFSGFVPTATINNAAPAGFVANPAGAPGGPLVWGQGNGDGSLDLPVNGELVLTYQAQVQVSTAATVSNSVWVDWSSLDGSNADERTGAGCPAIAAPNDYCAGPASASVVITDANSLNKLVVADSYVDALSTASDATLRIGDTVTYRLELNLAEGSTDGVRVEDVLPGGMAFENLVGITSSPGSNFSYSIAAQPAAGDTGTLVWDLGEVANAPSNDGTRVDTLMIEYRARVLPDAGIDHLPAVTLTNVATLSYVDGGGAPVVDADRLASEASVTLWQPVMNGPRKIDRLGRIGTAAAPLNVDLASDIMQFRLESCNADGLAPAYGVVLTDVLAAELDEGSLSTPVVSVGGVALGAADYSYTPPAGRGGSFEVQLHTPVAPGQCVTVDYEIGFHTDVDPNQTWHNSVILDEYWSLPLQAGQRYAPLGPARFYMSNRTTFAPLLKALVSAPEATVGDEVVYRITVPGAPVNATMNDVRVSDTLHPALEYLGASAVDGNGAAVGLVDSSAAGQVELDIAEIPAGEQVIITLTTRVANNDQANAGESFSNTASYNYPGLPAGTITDGSSEQVTIIEPLLTIDKTVANLSAPEAAPNPGDILRYSISFTAQGGNAGDQSSDAFDLLITDSLDLGLAYQSGSATVNGSGNVITDPATNGADGSSSAQVLTWSLADASADIDVAEGTTVTVSYDVLVLNDVQPGQTLNNSAAVQWTGLDGDSPLERNGSASPPENDYYAGPAVASITSEFALSFEKFVVNATTGEDPGANAEPGDTLRYRLVLGNESIAPLSGLRIVDELAAEFAPGSLQLISVSDSNGDTSNTAPDGGSNGTGLIDIRDLSLGAQGGADDTLVIEFEATLAPVITNGTIVLNKAVLTGEQLVDVSSNETSTLIHSAPRLRVLKTSEDLTGDPAELLPGETLRYTITVKNVGTENAVDVLLRDAIPVNTTYVAGSTTLNGQTVADPSPGLSPLQSGLLVHAPEDNTPGAMRADATGTADNVATITFDVVVKPNVVEGYVVSNQAFVAGEGVGSGPMDEQPSDDPGTPVLNDPTRDLVGNLPLLDAHKTVEISDDLNSVGIVDPGDELRYTIVITNMGSKPASGVVFTDAVPVNTTYVADSVLLNGQPVGQPDGGTSPLTGGISVNSSDQEEGSGIISAGGSAVVSFEVRVNDGVATGTIISNQGMVSSVELPNELTDADGIDSNGDQPTEIPVGDAQRLAITKEVVAVEGGTAEAGSRVDYLIRVTNVAAVPATNVTITDRLDPSLIYVAGSTRLNDSASGTSYLEPVLTADYSAAHGDLAPGDTATLRFSAEIVPGLPYGSRITNTAEVTYATDQSASATASIELGGTPGSGNVNGRAWHDANVNNGFDNEESPLADWTVEIYRNNQLIGTTTTDEDGLYQFNGLAPNDPADGYEVRFRGSEGQVSLGQGHSDFSNGPQRIWDIFVESGSNRLDLNLPIQPNGMVYDTVLRTPVAGATVTLLQASSGNPLPESCFDDPAQQNQVTTASGFYKFDINFSEPSCRPGDDYLIQVQEPASGYTAAPSQIIPPATHGDNAALSVPNCAGSVDDAIPATADLCEVQGLASAPPADIAARSDGTRYYLHLTLSDGHIPGESQLFNNHIPVDPELDSAVFITKTTSAVNVSRGDLVPYTITITNTLAVLLQDLTLVDMFPAGFKYVEGSARFDGVPMEPEVNGLQLFWEDLDLASDVRHTIQLLLVVGAGVGEAEYVNRAQVVNTLSRQPVSSIASATVRVVPDPTLDCTDVTGKVFDDANRNGYQDQDEPGLPGVRVATVRGLLVTSDEHGRFHITCAVVPNQDRGSNFILKLDDRSLPTGYRLTTENPRVQRATRGKALDFNFGATIHRVVRLDIADGVFQPDSTEVRLQWLPSFETLLEQLRQAPSILRLSYLADVEDESLVKDRLNAVKKRIKAAWEQEECCQELTIETEVFWRRGGPPRGFR